MPNRNGGWGDVDEGGWGGGWGVIAAAAPEGTANSKAGKAGKKKNQKQTQAQTYNKDNNTKKGTKTENESEKNADNPWVTNADGWGGGWADEAPATPAATDDDPKTSKNAVDDDIGWATSWDDNPWTQTDEIQGI